MSAKKIFLVVLWCCAIVSVVIVTFIVYALYKSGENMIEEAYGYSENIAESKQNNLFLGVYTPLDDSLSLNDSTVKTEVLWYEKQWRWNYSISDEPQRKMFPGINLIAPYYFPELTERNISITILIGGVEDKLALQHYNDSSYIGYYAGSPDTIALIVTSTTGFKSNNLQTFKDTVWYSKEDGAR